MKYMYSKIPRRVKRRGICVYRSSAGISRLISALVLAVLVVLVLLIVALIVLVLLVVALIVLIILVGHNFVPPVNI